MLSVNESRFAHLKHVTLLWSFGFRGLAKSLVASTTRAKFFNSLTALNISDDSMSNSFVTHSLQMALLQAACRFLVRGSSNI